MPHLRAALLCDFVKERKGLLDIINGGLDLIVVREFPASTNLGLALAVTFTRHECERPHRVEAILQTEDGDRILQLNASSTPSWDSSLPPGAMKHTGIGVNFGATFNGEGLYQMVVVIDDDEKDALHLRVRHSPQQE